MPRDSWTDADAAEYVECAECGCPVHRHDTTGCLNLGGECPCSAEFTRAEVTRLYRAEGLRVPTGGAW